MKCNVESFSIPESSKKILDVGINRDALRLRLRNLTLKAYNHEKEELLSEAEQSELELIRYVLSQLPH